jgi:predicted aldo/keto reductase-like oxidoreductase
LEYGVNHIDTAASYGDAELRIGPWMKQHRSDFFLATKTEKRTYQAALDELQRSLERMRVDSVDLWQMHFLADPQEWEVAMGPGGVLEAFIEARDKGLVRFLGVTGHGVTKSDIEWKDPSPEQAASIQRRREVTIAEMHMRGLERFDFDSVLLPYNYAMMRNDQYAADFEALTAMCRKRRVAVQTIKTITKAPWGKKKQNRSCWYEPFEEQADIDAAVHWAMNRPDIFLNTVGDIHVLPKVLDAASRFEPSSQEAIAPRLASAELEPLFV